MLAANTLSDWSNVAQVATAVVTVLGVLASMYLSVRALREVQMDRRLRHKPYVAFEGGGWVLPLEFKRVGKRIPGMNPLSVEKHFADLSDDAESIQVKGFPRYYGVLINFGLGPALETRVSWIAKQVTIGSETFEINGQKSQEPRYLSSFNTLPLMPGHVMPNTAARLARIPTFIDKDSEKKLKVVNGVLEIRCEDVFGQTHLTTQEFRIRTEYDNETPEITLTFGDVLYTDGRSG
jgi:hypothetical protein